MNYIRPVYHTYILDLGGIQSYFTQRVLDGGFGLNIQPDWIEDLFDWCVREALVRIYTLPGVSVHVDLHYRHDVAKCVYDHVGHVFEMEIKRVISLNQLNITSGKLKVMTAGINLFIAHGAK